MPLLGSHPSKGSVLRQPLRIYENGDAKCRSLRFRGPGEDSFANVIALANPGAGFLESWSAQDHWELAAPALCASVHRPTSDLGLDQIVARNRMFFFDPPGRSCRAFSFEELALRSSLFFRVADAPAVAACTVGKPSIPQPGPAVLWGFT